MFTLDPMFIFNKLTDKNPLPSAVEFVSFLGVWIRSMISSSEKVTIRLKIPYALNSSIISIVFFTEH